GRRPPRVPRRHPGGTEGPGAARAPRCAGGDVQSGLSCTTLGAAPTPEPRMSIAANLVIALIALLHVWFLVLEMFLWTRPLGRRTFGLTAARKILWFQALPAAVGLMLVLLA